MMLYLVPALISFLLVVDCSLWRTYVILGFEFASMSSSLKKQSKEIAQR